MLAVLGRQPSHGLVVAHLMARDGQLGRVWHIPKAIIYRSIGRLLDAGLIELVATEQGFSSPLLARSRRQAREGGFDATLLAWRKANALTALGFLDAISGATARSSPSPRSPPGS